MLPGKKMTISQNSHSPPPPSLSADDLIEKLDTLSQELPFSPLLLFSCYKEESVLLPLKKPSPLLVLWILSPLPSCGLPLSPTPLTSSSPPVHFKQRTTVVQRPCYSKWDSWTSSTGLTWELVRNVESPTPHLHN